jgi:4-amino-4-deoxy-L-arabinose transferase-like glycosyltransferase
MTMPAAPAAASVTKPRKAGGVAFLLLPAVLFLCCLGQKDVVTSHEARVVQTARRMAVSGNPWNATRVTVPIVGLQQTPAGLRLGPIPDAGTHDVNPWLVPVLSGTVRLQKPPLPYWCAAILFRLGGAEFSEGLARFFPALFGALSAFLIADLSGRLLGRKTSILAGLVWLSCYFVFDEFRKAMADPYLAFFSLVSIWAWIRATDAAPRRAVGWLLIGYASFALASLAKFPVNVLHVGCALAAFQVCSRRRLPGPWVGHLLGVVVFLAIFLPWPLYVLTHVPHAMELWRYESVGEFADNTEKARPFWFYLLNIFSLILPWTAVWIGGAALVVRRRARRHWFALAWLLSEVVIFSLSNVKKNAYLLPVMPAMVLITVQGLRLLWASRRLAAIRRPSQWLAAAQAVIGIGLAVAVTVTAFLMQPRDMVRSSLLAIGVLVAAIAAARLAWQQRWVRWSLWQCVAYAAGIFALFATAVAPHENERTARDIAATIQPLLAQGATIDPALPEDVALYLPLDLAYATADSKRVVAVIDDRSGQATGAFTYGKGAAAAGAQITRMDLGKCRGSSRWKVFVLNRPD